MHKFDGVPPRNAQELLEREALRVGDRIDEARASLERLDLDRIAAEGRLGGLVELSNSLHVALTKVV